jgi:hypothetical protein
LEGSARITVAQKNVVIEAPQQQVWKVLGSAIFQCLPLEEMNIIDQKNFQAVLKWRLGFFSIPLNLKGKVTDILSPDLMSFVIQVEKWLLRMSLKVTFTLKQVNEGSTEIAGIATVGKQTLIGRIMSGQQRSFATKTFDEIMARLQEVR